MKNMGLCLCMYSTGNTLKIIITLHCITAVSIFSVMVVCTDRIVLEVAFVCSIVIVVFFGYDTEVGGRKRGRRRRQIRRVMVFAQFFSRLTFFLLWTSYSAHEINI